MRASRSTIGVAIGLAVALTGCSQIQRRDAEQIAPQLSAAGFKPVPADTPDKLAKLQAMPQCKLQSMNHDGKRYYVFADAQGCRCMYLGDKAAFDRYRAARAVQQQEMAVQDEDFEAMDENAAPDWGMWGIDSW
jgi:hypothetical protein